MAKYELNSDGWSYGDHIYHRGDEIEIDEVTDFVKSLIDSKTLVEVGHAEKLRKADEKAEQERLEREAKQREIDDAEAHRRVAAQEARIAGEVPGSRKVSNVSSQDGPKTTRSSTQRK